MSAAELPRLRVEEAAPEHPSPLDGSPARPRRILGPGEGVTNTAGWDEAQLRGYIERTRQAIGWPPTGHGARKWWEAFEQENSHRLRLVARVADEIARRGATFDEYFVSFIHSNTANIAGTLAYLEYKRLKVPRAESPRPWAEELGPDVAMAISYVQRYHDDPGRLRKELDAAAAALATQIRTGRRVNLRAVAARLSRASFGVLSVRGVLAYLLPRLPRCDALDEIADLFPGLPQFLAGGSKPDAAPVLTIDDLWRRVGLEIPAEPVTPQTGPANSRALVLVGGCKFCGELAPDVLELTSSGRPAVLVCNSCLRREPGAVNPDVCSVCGQAVGRFTAALVTAGAAMCAGCRAACRRLAGMPESRASAPAVATAEPSPRPATPEPPELPPAVMASRIPEAGGQSVPELLAMLRNCLTKLRSATASTQARNWWATFTADAADHLRLVVRLAEEAFARDYTLEELYQAYLWGETDNIQAVICYASYSHLRAKEDRRKVNRPAESGG